MIRKRSIASYTSALILVLGLAAPAGAQVLPGEIKAALMAKLLGFDRKLKARSPDGVRIGLVGASGSSTDIDSILKLDGKKVQGLAITVVPLLDVSAADLPARLGSNRINAIYVLPKTKDGLLKAVISHADKNGVATFGGSKTLVERGLAVGFGVEDGKPRFFVNRKTSKRHGLELPARVLRLARLID